MDTSSADDSSVPLDLVGGPFTVIESDPGVFTSLVRKLGVRGTELVEVYGIESWALDHLKPYGLIFCFLWHKDSHRPAEFNDPAAENVWFANQLSDDACATHAILNVVLNCPEIDIGTDLSQFKQETAHMSPVMRGLAVTNVPMFRRVHNSLARPADIRGAMSALALSTLDIEKQKQKQQRKKTSSKPPPAKRLKADNVKKKMPSAAKDDDQAEQSYHFIGYVPAFGKVWELDGFKSGPLEVGELPITDGDVRDTWTDVVRPALRMKMDKYGGSGDDGSNIRFSLLAVVDDGYQVTFDELEFLKREKASLEKRLETGWETQVDLVFWEATVSANGRGALLLEPGEPYSSEFASKRMERDVTIMNMSQAELLAAWDTCVRSIARAIVTIEDELSKTKANHAEHINRTFDYEPFFKGFISALHNEGILNELLDLDQSGKKRGGRKAQKP
ncbi:ubiquitin C-terminal hydrolase [Coprinopsis sp. MPI-PUGE-AT-0042]|nr:ubiquitin C-terminal hydrolase [Coprinopsis sp. MPI-PUGE-AT-0042]